MEQISSHKIARIISTIFVPPSFTVLLFTLFAIKLESSFIKTVITIIVAVTFGFSFLILLFAIFHKNGKLADIDASIKEERTVPFLIAVILYITGLIILIIYNINIVSIAFWFCYISNTLIIVIINKFWKISAHAMGASGALAAITYVYGTIGLIFILLVALIGWSRIELKCHTVSQVTAGAVLGFLSTYIQMYFIINYIQYAR